LELQTPKFLRRYRALLEASLFNIDKANLVIEPFGGDINALRLFYGKMATKIRRTLTQNGYPTNIPFKIVGEVANDLLNSST
jgi:hypothetical protein